VGALVGRRVLSDFGGPSGRNDQAAGSDSRAVLQTLAAVDFVPASLDDLLLLDDVERLPHQRCGFGFRKGRAAEEARPYCNRCEFAVPRIIEKLLARRGLMARGRGGGRGRSYIDSAAATAAGKTSLRRLRA